MSEATVPLRVRAEASRQLVAQLLPTVTSATVDNAEGGGIDGMLQSWVKDGDDLQEPLISYAFPQETDDATYELRPRPTNTDVEPRGQELNYGDMTRQQKQHLHQRERLLRAIQEGRKHVPDIVRTTCAVASLPFTTTGWSGKDYHRRQHLDWLESAWECRQITRIMLNEDFQKVPFQGNSTFFVDQNGTGFAFRSGTHNFMHERFQGCDDKTLLQAISDDCTVYIVRCGDREFEAIVANNRGDHWYMVIGVDRQNTKIPKMTQFELQHMEQTTWLLRPEGPIARLINAAKFIFECRFPSLVQRVNNCVASLKAQGFSDDIAVPRFGYWYNFCINGPTKSGVHGVMTKPHVDGKNLALMMCVVFVWGDFDYKEKAWLVLWEAKIIIELPPGVFLFYPSALFTHFNCDITDAEFVTTADGSVPTKETASPLCGVKGRGSIVFFNQATMFQLAEVKGTIKDARAAGRTTTCDNDAYISTLPTM